MSQIETLEARKAEIELELDTLITAAETESRAFSDEETAKQDTLVSEHRSVVEKITSAKAADEVRKQMSANSPRPSASVVSEPNPVYRRDNHHVSFFADLFNANTRNDNEARARLVSAQETRAISTTAGQGGQLAPPLWLIDDFVALAAAGRVTADRVQHDALETGIASISLPTIASGTSAAVVSTQNSALSQTDLTTSSVTSGITTIAGLQTVSIQLLSQSGTPIDRVVLGDLARAYAIALDGQVLSGSGASGQLQGILGLAGINAITYTQASPTVSGTGQFYSQLIQAINAIQTNRYDSPDTIVMHPRRWNWVLDAFDSQNRPFVTPDPYPQFNGLGNAAGTPVAKGLVGSLLGVNVFVDPNMPTNLGGGTNQDAVIVMKADDLWLYESSLQTASFDATYANQGSVLFRALGFSAFIPGRYPKSIAAINGTGLITPTF